MTKAVRIENADNSDYRIVVEVWTKGLNGNPDTKASESELPYPTHMETFLLHSGNYFIVRETPAKPL